MINDMCARFSITSPLDALKALFDILPGNTFPVSYNIAPGTFIPIIRRKRGNQKPEMSLALWNFIPAWKTEISESKPLVNARLETVTEKVTFQNAFRSRRCLIPCSGFYEWKTTAEGEKQPFYIYSKTSPFFFLAGIWEETSLLGKEAQPTSAVMTTAASSGLAAIHHRMPVTIKPEHIDRWLSGNDLSSVPDEHKQEVLSSHPVDRKVGNVRNNNADLIKEVPFDNRPRQGSLF